MGREESGDWLFEEPGARFASATDVCKVLTGQAPGNAPAKQNKRRKRRKPILAAALATLLLALVLGYYLKSPARKAPQGPVESAASDDKTIRLWDTASGKLLKTATEHQSLVNAFAMSPDKQFLVSVSEDSKIKLWRLPELVFVKTWEPRPVEERLWLFFPMTVNIWRCRIGKERFKEYQGTPPDWSLQQRFQLGKEVVYMVCPGRDVWWAVVPFGDEAGFWRIPAKDLKQAVRVSSTPADYCSTGSDGQLTAALFLNRIELWSNSDGQLAGTYRFPARQGDAVGISRHPPMVIAGFAKGDIMAWPLRVGK